MTKKLGISLSQSASGKWTAGGPALRTHSVVIEEDTPNAALESAVRFLELFEDFIDHLYGMCDASVCDKCKDGLPRGVRNGKRPPRYDAKAWK